MWVHAMMLCGAKPANLSGQLGRAPFARTTKDLSDDGALGICVVVHVAPLLLRELVLGGRVESTVGFVVSQPVAEIAVVVDFLGLGLEDMHMNVFFHRSEHPVPRFSDSKDKALRFKWLSALMTQFSQLRWFRRMIPFPDARRWIPFPDANHKLWSVLR